MAIPIIDNFQLNSAKPIDDRLVVGGNNRYPNKEAIELKYVGLRVWDINESNSFVWNGSDWEEDSGGSGGGISGTSSYIPVFNSSNTIGSSIIYQNNGKIGINNTNPSSALDVNGTIKATTLDGNISAEKITSGNLPLGRLSAGGPVEETFLIGTPAAAQWRSINEVLTEYGIPGPTGPQGATGPGAGATPSFQEITDVGATTSNTVIVQSTNGMGFEVRNPNGDLLGHLINDDDTTGNLSIRSATGSNLTSISSGYISLTNVNGIPGSIDPIQLTASLVLSFPPESGNQDIATRAWVESVAGAPTLDEVLTEGSNTGQSIIIEPANFFNGYYISNLWGTSLAFLGADGDQGILNIADDLSSTSTSFRYDRVRFYTDFSNYTDLVVDTPNGVRTITLPNASGTVALTSDLPSSLWELASLYNLRVPTQPEWEAERLTWSTNNSAGAFASTLKLSLGGYRTNSVGSITSVNTVGRYWTSTVNGVQSQYLNISSSIASANNNGGRALGFSIRLILDGSFTLSEFQNNYENETIEIDVITYGYVYNSTTERIWLDRNLGATQVATSATDTLAHGYLNQWGRGLDGHQIRTSSTTNTLSSTDQPGHGDFITNGNSPQDWRSPQNDNLWQGVLGINTPGLIYKLIGSDGVKVDYNDLLNIPEPPEPPTPYVGGENIVVDGFTVSVDIPEEDLFTNYGTTGANPRYIAIDYELNVYTLNTNSQNISKIEPDGTSTILASVTSGGGSSPNNIIMAHDGNLYVTNGIENNVRKITLGGTASILGTTGDNPQDLVMDSSGNIYTANFGANNVTKITPGGTSSVFATVGTQPSRITIDKEDNLYVVNFGSENISKITPGGTSSIFASTGAAPRGITTDRHNNIYVLNRTDKNVYKITPAGDSITLGDTIESGPESLVVDYEGNVYTSNFNASGTVTKITSGTSSILSPTGDNPHDLVIGVDGNIYTVNTSSLNITKIDPYVDRVLAVNENREIIRTHIPKYLDGIGIEIDTTVPKTPIIGLKGVNTTGNYSLNSIDGEVEWVEHNPIILKTTVTVTPAQMLDLVTNPVEILPSPGIGRVISVHKITMFLDFNTTVYDFQNPVASSPTFKYGSTSDDVGTIGDIYINSATDRYFHAIIKNEEGVMGAQANEGVFLTVTTDATQGDSPLKIIVTYTVDDFN